MSAPVAFSLSDLIGTKAVMVKTITESDLIGFAEISGDSHPNHTDEDYARDHGLGGRVAQGSLLVGMIAGASSVYLEAIGRPAVSYGYDRVRFLKPVLIGETLRVEYCVIEADIAKSNVKAQAQLFNTAGELVAVGINILHFT